MKITGVETHYLGSDGKIRLSAVDWWRIINPLTHLAKNTDIEVKFIKKIVEKGKDDDTAWSELGEDTDILWTSYISTPKAYAFIKAIQDRYNVKYVMDLDDNLFEVDKMNPVYLRYYPGSEDLKNSEIIVADAQAMSCTTTHLKQLLDMRRGGKSTEVLPNYIDPQVYKYDPRLVPDNGEKIVIGYQGSSTHYSDLFNTGVMWAIRRLMLKYENLHFYIIGTPIKEIEKYLPKDRVEMVGGERDHRNWIKAWQKLPIDIGIAPLTDTSFNMGKSNIKWQEYSLRKIPAVYSMVEPYRDSVVENETGFLANDEEEWFTKLEWLIENKALRKQLAHQAMLEVKKNWTIQRHWEKWENYLKQL